MFDSIKSFLLDFKSARPLSSAAALDLFGAPAGSGLHVDALAVMRCAPAAQGVRLISEAVATLDAALYRDTANGRETVAEHPVARVLRRPNPWTGESEFKRQLVADALLFGNAVATVSRVRGEVRELHRIHPRSVSIDLDPITGEPSYRVSLESGGTRELAFADVVHVRALSLDGARGLGLVDMGREAVGLALTLEQHAATLFGRGARPAGILEMPGRLTQEIVERLRASFGNLYHGPGNSGRTAILEQGVKFTPLQLASTDSQFLENRRFQVLEIARLLNIPPVLLGDLEHATLSNAESLAQQFLDRTITPLLEIFEDALERALLTDAERDAGMVIEFGTENFARANLAERFASYRTATEIGLLTINEARDREGLAPVAGGDLATRSVQTIPLDAPTTNEGQP